MDFLEYFNKRPCKKCESYMGCCSHRRDIDGEDTSTILNRLEDIMINGCGDCFIERKHYK